MQVAKGSVGATIDAAEVGNLQRQKHDLMPAALKFCAQIDVVQKRTTEVGHSIGEDEDLHCMRDKTGF